MNENINQLKSFSDSDICRNEEKGNLHLASQKTEMVKKTSLEREKGNEGGPKIIHKTQTITGTLTSRIETRQDYHYGFFSVPNQEQDIPVVFKTKPNLTKGQAVQLTGQWATSNGSRPSFTCETYTINETKEKAAHSASNIYQKLHCLQSQTDQISKKELNKFGNYKYFTEQQALKLLKPLLKEQKLTLTFSDIYNYTQPNGGFSSQKHEKEWMVSYPKQAILTNSENPEEQLIFPYWAIGSNSDPAKAKGCAETYAIKYFLTKFFLIPTTDELDPDVTKDHEYSNRLKDGSQETAQQIQARHQAKEQKRINELKQKYGPDWKLSQEYKQWMGNKEVQHE